MYLFILLENRYWLMTETLNLCLKKEFNDVHLNQVLEQQLVFKDTKNLNQCLNFMVFTLYTDLDNMIVNRLCPLTNADNNI